MYSNRYVAIHCLQKKYLNDLKQNGISRETKAVFICDLDDINEEVLLNTIAVSIYHGIGIDNWNQFIKSTNKYVGDELVIAIGEFEKEQMQAIQNDNIKNYYRVYNKTRTLDYAKIKDIGAVKSIKIIEQILPFNIKINTKSNIDPRKDRFFVKNVYADNVFEMNKTIDEIGNMCYEVARTNIKNFKKKLEIMKNELKEEEECEKEYKNCNIRC